MVGVDYIHGNEKRELTPQAPHHTRAEFAQIFHNIIQDYILAPGTYTEDYDGNLLVRTDERHPPGPDGGRRPHHRLRRGGRRRDIG